jgi:hypothetical protein
MIPKYKCTIEKSQAHSFVRLDIRVWHSYHPDHPERGEYKVLSSLPGLSIKDAEAFAQDLESIQLALVAGG